MTDYTELVKALRGKFIAYDGTGNHKSAQLYKDAADAIEALQAEVDEANKSADAYRAMYFAKRGDITIEKVRELDEIDCHFHSALIRLMYRRIEELESKMEVQDGQE